jgi:hypothetical protein
LNNRGNFHESKALPHLKSSIAAPRSHLKRCLGSTVEIVDLPSDKKWWFSIQKAIEIVDFPSYKMVDLSSSFFVCLPEGNLLENP